MKSGEGCKWVVLELSVVGLQEQWPGYIVRDIKRLLGDDEVFIPIDYDEKNEGSERKRVILPGYVFVKTGKSLRQLLCVMESKYVLKIVTVGSEKGRFKELVYVQESEIESIRERFNDVVSVVNIGDRVNIIDGVYSGMVGVVRTLPSEVYDSDGKYFVELEGYESFQRIVPLMSGEFRKELCEEDDIKSEWFLG